MNGRVFKIERGLGPCIETGTAGGRLLVQIEHALGEGE